MSHALRDRTATLLGLALAAWLLFAAPVHAQNISCSSVSMGPLSFGSVNPLSSLTTANATLSYTCTNSATSTRSATLCFSIGEPAGGPTSPRQMKDSAGNILQFQLYQNANHTTVWGSSFFGSITPLMVNVTIDAATKKKGTTTPGTTGPLTSTMYGQVSSGQTSAIPTGTLYQDNYQTGDTALTINETSGSTAPGTCNTDNSAAYFPFLVSAAVTRQCTVAAGAASNINLGSVPSSALNISGTNSVSVNCSNTTPYFIGLSPSNGDTAGAGTMSGTGTDKVPYQLYSDAGLSAVWGNTATASSVGNGVSGIGTGSVKSIPVWAKAPSADYTPDTYTDTVTVTVNY